MSDEIRLTPGIYDVTVRYSGGGSDAVIEFADSTIRAGSVTLQEKSDTVSFQAWVYETQPNAFLRLHAENSEVQIESLEIRYDPATGSYFFILRAVLFLLIDGFVLLYTHHLEIDSDTLMAAVGIVCASVLASAPLFMESIIPGHDMEFHLARIEGLAQGIQAGIFPVKVQPFWLGGRGYATGVFYGDLLLYFPAVLRLLGFSVQSAYKIYAVAVNFATALIFYECVRRIINNKKIALLGSFLYVLAPYRMSNMYVRSAVGEYTAMMFFPLIFYGLWKIFTLHKEKAGELSVWLPAAIGYCGLIFTHILTCEMVGFLTLVVCVVFIRRTLQKNVFFSLVKVVVAASLLSIGFLVPFFDYMRGSYNFNTSSDWESLSQTCLSPVQLFGLFGDGRLCGSRTLFEGISNEMLLGIGLPYILGCVLFIVLSIRYDMRQQSLWKVGNLALGINALCIWMASTFFPWDSICNSNAIIAKLVKTLQFAWRFLGVASFMSVIVLCCALQLLPKSPSREMNTKLANSALVLLCLVSWGSFTESYIRNNGGSYYYSAAQLDSYYVEGAEYLPTGTDTGLLAVTPEVTAEDTVHIENVNLDVLKVEVTADVEEGGTLTVPLLYYPYYHAVDNETGEELQLMRREGSSEIQVELPKGYSGCFTVAFRTPFHWTLSYLLNIVSVATILGVSLKRKVRTKVRI